MESAYQWKIRIGEWWQLFSCKAINIGFGIMILSKPSPFAQFHLKQPLDIIS